MKINLPELFPIIHINLADNRASLNDLARELFKDKNIQEVVQKINVNKKIDFLYLDTTLYTILIFKGVKNLYLLFVEVEDSGMISLKTDKNVDVEIYKREMLNEFLEKFLALKRRYGGFTIKFLYFKIEFSLNISNKLKEKYIREILKYTLAVTRSSDVVGQISEMSFGVILTNANLDGANVVAKKILKFIAELNKEFEKRLIETYAILAHEVFILKNRDFNELVKSLDENSEFITIGINLKEIVKV